VAPGSYQVKLTVGDKVHTRTLDVRLDPDISISAADSALLESTLAQQADLVAATYHANKAVKASVTQTTALLKALKDGKASRSLIGQAEAALKEAERLDVVLNGKEEGLAQQETFLPLSELALRLYSTTQEYTAAPDGAQRRLTQVAQADVKTLYRDLAALLSQRLPALKAAAQGGGVAWPAGDLPQLPSGNFVPTQP